MHSPWGTLYSLVSETGWSWHEILWKVSRVNLMLMMADRPNVKYHKKPQEPEKKKVTGKQLANILRGK